MPLPVLLLSVTDIRARTVAVQYGHLLDEKELHFPFAFCPHVDERSETFPHYFVADELLPARVISVRPFRTGVLISP
jgi:hypothetical protein